MINKIEFKDAQECINNLKDKKTQAILLFTGQKGEDGINWCPDCREVEPHYKALED